MDSVIKSIVDTLINQGLSGIFIVILLYGLNYIYRANEKLQNQRVEELRTLTQVVERNTAVLSRSTEALARMIEVIKGCNK